MGKHECHAIVGLHASSCRINHGDTLSEDALAVYGKWRLYSTKLMGANPQIVDADKIYADAWITIPDATPQSSAATAVTPRVQPHAIATVAALLASLRARSANVPMELVPAPTTTVIPMEAIAAMPMQARPFPSPAMVTEAVQQPPPPPTPTLSPTGRKIGSNKKVAGYKLVIPKDIAATTGIVLNTPLATYYLPYNNQGKQVGYVRLKKNTWARQEGNNIVLYIPLATLPVQPFSLTIAGINEPIDGELFAANAQPVYGKIPGPHNELRIIFSAITLGGSGYTLSAAFGPIVGPSVVAGIFTTREILHHRANAVVKHAEQTYNATLAQQGATPPEEIDP